MRAYDNDDDLNDQRVKSGQPNALCSLHQERNEDTQSIVFSVRKREGGLVLRKNSSIRSRFTTVICGLSVELIEISRSVEWFLMRLEILYAFFMRSLSVLYAFFLSFNSVFFAFNDALS